MESVISL